MEEAGDQRRTTNPSTSMTGRWKATAFTIWIVCVPTELQWAAKTTSRDAVAAPRPTVARNTPSTYTRAAPRCGPRSAIQATARALTCSVADPPREVTWTAPPTALASVATRHRPGVYAIAASASETVVTLK